MLFRRRWKDAPVDADGGFPSSELRRVWGPGPARAAEPAWVSAANDLVYRRMADEDLDDHEAGILSLGYPLISGRSRAEMPAATFLAMRSMAAVGYMSRQAEYERFPLARAANGDRSSILRIALDAASGPVIQDSIEGSVDLAAAAAWLARGEAIDPHSTDEFRPSWAVPGVGHDERRHLRERTLPIVVRSQPDGPLETPEGEVRDATLDDFRRTWKYGFFVRSLVEIVLWAPRADED